MENFEAYNMTPEKIEFDINHTKAERGEIISYRKMSFEKAYKKLKKDFKGVDFNIWNVKIKY